MQKELYELTPEMSLFLDYADKNGWAVMMSRWHSAVRDEWNTSYAVRHNGITVETETDPDIAVSVEEAQHIIELARERMVSHDL